MWTVQGTEGKEGPGLWKAGERPSRWRGMWLLALVVRTVVDNAESFKPHGLGWAGPVSSGPAGMVKGVCRRPDALPRSHVAFGRDIWVKRW